MNFSLNAANKTGVGRIPLLVHQLEYIIGKKVNLYYPPILVAIGLFGNAIAFLVYSQRHVRIMSTPIYLCVLSAFDSLMLLVGLLQYWILFNFYPKALTKEHCYGMFFVVNALGNFTHWLIVVISIDRFIAVVFPLKRSKMAQPRVAYYAITFTGVFAILKNLHYIWTTDFTYHAKSGNALCAFALIRKGAFVTGYQWFETLVSSLLPFGIILTLNTCIITALRRRSSEMAKRYKKNPMQQASFRIVPEKSLTILLLIVSTTFVILTSPLMICRLYFSKIKFQNNVRLNAIYNLAHHITHKLWYTNNGINFFIYSLFGNKFRKDMKMLWSTMSRRQRKSCTTVVQPQCTDSGTNCSQNTTKM